MLPPSCCQARTTFGRQQLTLFQATVSTSRGNGDKEKPQSAPLHAVSARRLFAVCSHHQFLKLVFILLLWQGLCLQDAGKRLELSILFPAPLLVPSVLPLGTAEGESLTSAAALGCLRPPSVPQFISLLPTLICIFKNSMSQA